jgi:hypothetical protein
MGRNRHVKNEAVVLAASYDGLRASDIIMAILAEDVGCGPASSEEGLGSRRASCHRVRSARLTACNKEGGTVSIANDVFTVFISHKHEDHALAVEVKKNMQGLNPELIDCFVSGVDITAGMDWRRQIRGVLAKSHLLVLLFTAPSKNWDWCLFETGLYTRFDQTEARSVICLFSPGEASPSPLADLQGVPATADKVRDFLESLCCRTWEISDDWRRGALAPEITSHRLNVAARAIADAFGRSGSASTYYRAIAWYCRCPRPTTSREGSPRVRR